MTRIHERVETGLSIDEAFDYIADFDHADEWDPNTTGAKRLGDVQPGPGARFALEVRMGGRTAPMEYRITEYDRPRRVVLVGEGSGVVTVDDIRFERIGDRTVVDYVADIRLGGLLRLAQPFLGGAFRRIGQQAAEGMNRELARRAAGRVNGQVA
jgi:carbon monoxide dehydrogenase subunit G